MGKVESIEYDKKKIEEARKKTGNVAVRLKSNSSILYGRHFDENDQLVSLITRKSIDLLKEHYRDYLTKTEWNLVRKLKAFHGID